MNNNKNRRFRRKKDLPFPINSFKQDKLHKTMIGDPKGAIRQYRDNKETNSLHVREYPDKISAHVDKYNPERRPLEHLMEDIPVSKRNAAIVGGILGGLITWISTKNRGATVLGIIGGAAIGYTLIDD